MREIPMKKRPNNNNNNLENEVNVPRELVNDREQPNPILMNRNQNAN